MHCFSQQPSRTSQFISLISYLLSLLSLSLIPYFSHHCAIISDLLSRISFHSVSQQPSRTSHFAPLICYLVSLYPYLLSRLLISDLLSLIPYLLSLRYLFSHLSSRISLIPFSHLISYTWSAVPTLLAFAPSLSHLIACLLFLTWCVVGLCLLALISLSPIPQFLSLSYELLYRRRPRILDSYLSGPLHTL